MTGSPMPDGDFQERLVSRAKLAGLDVSKPAASSLDEYFQLLQKWNRRMSLTSLALDAVSNEAIDRLFIEPLQAAAYLPSRAHVLDVGSGGGSPAIPLKIGSSGISLVMVEATIKKAAFLREVVRQLSLKDVTVEEARVEDLTSRPELRAKADVATLRAVKTSGKLFEVISWLTKDAGEVFLFTSDSPMPSDFPAPFREKSRHSLLPSSRSTLVVLSKESDE